MASKNSQQPKKVELNINDMNLYQINAIKQQLDQVIYFSMKSIPFQSLINCFFLLSGN